MMFVKPHVWTMVLGVALLTRAAAQERVLDSFETPGQWKSFASDGVEVSVRQTEGVRGRAIALSYRFHGGGYCGISRDLPMPLPSNYAFSFYVKGRGPANTLEVKFSDTTGENVWWKTLKDFMAPPSWQRERVKKRHIAFAWGPHPSPSIPFLGRIEFVISAGTGGIGEIVIDELQFEGLEATPGAYPPPRVTASSEVPRMLANHATDGDSGTAWQGAHPERGDWFEWDFARTREFGGLELEWDDHLYPSSYAVLGSQDGRAYDTLYQVQRGNGGRRIIPLPDAEARSVRLLLPPGVGTSRLRESGILPVAATINPNALFSLVAQGNPRGLFPKYLLNEATYWTVIGLPSDPSEGLINTEAAVEVDKSRFSLEPFLYLNGRCFTWNEVSTAQHLVDGELPLPLVTWTGSGFHLETTAFAWGKPDSSEINVRYILKNTGMEQLRGRFFVAIRPFQVNPAYQWLNTQGGVAQIHRMDRKGALITVDEKALVALPPPNAFGTAGFDEGDISEFLLHGMLPASTATIDTHGYASGALGYDVNLPSGDSLAVSVIIPFHGIPQPRTPLIETTDPPLSQARRFWDDRLSSVRLHLPGSGSKIVSTLRSNLAYILINMDGPGIQPGSRSYERSWIRDGSLTSAALLRMGFSAEARLFLDWYSQYQYPDGKIPCVVDARGPDPVAEHDSHGEFVYAVMQYFRFTHDKGFLRGKWPAVQKAVEYIQSLRAPHLTEAFAAGNDSLRAFYGLVTESISHEGYSAKPMHSYWDNFFVLRGFKDAALMAAILDDRGRQAEYDSLAKEFRRLLLESIARTMASHGIDYIPGCVELGDFDPTSTTNALYPVDEGRHLPAKALRATFDRYFTFATDRASGDEAWTAFTPYELRTVGSFVYLGMKERAHTLLEWFFHFQRPAEWNHWAEVVWRDPSRAAFVGDMPHTWVGSDFINAARAMLVYEREEDSSLVVAAGVPEAWLTDKDSVWVDDLHTYYGSFGYSMTRHGDTTWVTLRPGQDFAARAVVVPSPLDKPLRRVSVNGRELPSHPEAVVKVDATPAVVMFVYR